MNRKNEDVIRELKKASKGSFSVLYRALRTVAAKNEIYDPVTLLNKQEVLDEIKSIMKKENR